uniref:Rx N-terminal domain-containing protein n=1 Tax=Leersia perrieri TaxID=77586 RepID=A0A0D9UX52_9ORYZ
MAILDSPLMGEFIQFLKSNWGTNSRVSQRRRRLRQLVAMVRGVADAAEDRAALRGGSLNAWLQQLRMVALRGQAVLDATTDATAVAGAARMLLAGVRMMFVCSAEVDRLAQAVDELERLAGPGGDLDLFVKVLQLDAAAAAMDIDGEEGVGISWVRSANSSPAILPNPGEKRKRGGISSIVDGDGDGESLREMGPKCRKHGLNLTISV